MAKPPKRIDENQFRFDCECGRIHIFTSEDGGKTKVETIEPTKKTKDPDDDADNGRGKTTAQETPPARRKGFLEQLGI